VGPLERLESARDGVFTHVEPGREDGSIVLDRNQDPAVDAGTTGVEPLQPVDRIAKTIFKVQGIEQIEYLRGMVLCDYPKLNVAHSGGAKPRPYAANCFNLCRGGLHARPMIHRFP
jgi:hypothetical protein